MSTCLVVGQLGLVLGALFAASVALAQAQAPGSGGFQAFVESVWPDAQKAGVSRATFDRAFKDVTPDMSLPDLVVPGKLPGQERGQAEFIRPPQDYLNREQLARLAESGKAFMARHLPALERIEREIGVERHVVMGIWGRETAFGTHKLPHYAIRVLATQAWTGRRREMFRNELLAGLKMLEARVITIETMRASWAGAMGLPQFMPSEYFIHAHDLDGDGRADIWNSVPDALASAARQLKAKGWRMGVPWGIEVSLPKPASIEGAAASAVDCAYEGPDDSRSFADWAKLGIRRADGSPLPPALAREQAYLMSPGGTHGPIFLASDNFKVIRAYNTSDLYAVFVGHLADRIRGGGNFSTPWRGIGQLPTAEIEETQRRLKERGFAVDKIDGKIGSNTRRNIGLFQRRAAIEVDCWPGPGTLRKLRSEAASR